MKNKVEELVKNIQRDWKNVDTETIFKAELAISLLTREVKRLQGLIYETYYVIKPLSKYHPTVFTNSLKNIVTRLEVEVNNG